MGAGGIETDVQRTADGVLVLIHDATVDRTTDGTGAVNDLTWDQLSRLDAGSWLDPKWAGERIVPGGRLIVLSPAHPWLYSAFDAAVGHVRRYTRASLEAAAPAGWTCERLDHLDAAGLLASASNRLLLRRSLPTPSQLAFWDGVLVRVSRRIDARLGYRLGKSVLAVWRKPVD